MSSLRPKVTLTTEIKDAYYPDMARIFILAFDPSWIGERLNPLEERLSLEKRIAASARSRALTALHPSPDTREVVALLNGHVVGYATWSSPVDRTSTVGYPLPAEVVAEAESKDRMEKNKANVVREVEASQDLVWFGQFKEQLAKVRREWSQGRGHWYLNVIAVDPAYNNTGIGSQLLAWGTDQAEKDGVPCWLEASEQGRLLYDRRGWEVKNWCELPDEKRPGEKLRWPGMALGEFKEEIEAV